MESSRQERLITLIYNTLNYWRLLPTAIFPAIKQHSIEICTILTGQKHAISKVLY